MQTAQCRSTPKNVSDGPRSALVRYEPGDHLIAPGNEDLLTPFHAVEQRRQVRLRFTDLHVLGHGLSWLLLTELTNGTLR